MLLEPNDQLIYQIRKLGMTQFLSDFITSYCILGSWQLLQVIHILIIQMKLTHIVHQACVHKNY